MLEESISCSPGNNGKKSRSRRFHKNAKRKFEQHKVTPTMDNILPQELSNLEALYEESTHSGTINATTHFEYFNPFENEKLLAAADRAEASTSSSKLQNLTSQGFVRLESLPFKDENKISYMKPPQGSFGCHSAVTPKSPQVLGPETQFGITESEFMRFCDDAESDVFIQSLSDVKSTMKITNVSRNDFSGLPVESDIEIKTIKKSKTIVEEILTDFCGSPTESEIEEQTPPKSIKGTKSIVDEILEDFCGSPNKESSPKSIESTPIFRFKSQPIRTYSGLRKKKQFRRNIAPDLNVFTLKDDGNTSDSSSGLSVQEDLSQSVVPQLDTVDLNNSVKLCENLLNLSSYFSQLTSSSKGKSPPSAVDCKKTVQLSAIIEEIIKIKSKSIRINLNKSEEEFRGFSDYESDSNQSTLQELLEDEDDVLQQINCDSLCYEKVEPKISFTHLDHDLENTLKNASAVIKKANELLLSGPDMKHKAENSTNTYQPDCDIHKDMQHKIIPNSPLKDEQLFDDIDIWNDNECLLNYKTQKPYQKRLEHADNNILKEEFKNKFIYNENDSESFKDLKSSQNAKHPYSSNSLKLLVASRRKDNLKTNKEHSIGCEKGEVGSIYPIDSFSSTNFNHSNEEDAANGSLLDNKLLNKSITSNFTGFATVSKKPIFISDIARQKATEFLKKFEQHEFEEKICLNKNEKEDIAICNVPTTALTDDQNDNNLSSTSSYIKETHTKEIFVEHSTSSKKPISLTKGAKKKDCEIMNKIQKEKREKPIVFKENKETNETQFGVSSEDIKSNNTLNNNCAVGFSTASKKTICISFKAKQTANEILKKFEQNEQENGTTNVTSVKYIDNNKQNDRASKKNADNLTGCGFVGFSTASEKPIAISLKAKRKAEDILKKFEQAEKVEEETKGMALEKLSQRHPDEVSEEVRRKAQDLLLDIEFFEEAFEDELKEIGAGPMSQVQDEIRTAKSFAISSNAKEPTQAKKEHFVEGFKTASRKSIHISNDARRRAETFLKAVYDEDLPQEFLQCIETDINDTNFKDKNPVGNLMSKIEQFDGAIKRPFINLHGVLKTDSQHMHDTHVLEIKNTSDGINIKNRTFDHSFEKNEEFIEDPHLHSREYDRIDNIKKRKRKRKHSEGQELEKPTPLVTPRRSSCGERTPLNRIENGLLSKSSSFPLKECTPKSTLISRKNLLSLSKRKKSDSPGQIIELSCLPKTPEKEQHLLTSHCNASSTPRLKDFFDSVSTSTPRGIRNDPTNRTNVNTSKDPIDSDFRRIQWEDSNNSIRINRTSCVDDVNVTFSEVSPSPIQRIERLKMYGEPPPISPILMINKCRPSGLRRGRSLMKP